MKRELVIQVVFFFFFYIFNIFTLINSQQTDTTINNDRVLINDLNESNKHYINVAITFTKAKTNFNLQEQFKRCIRSLLKHATIDTNFFIIGDNESQLLAKKYFTEVENVKIKYNVSNI